MRLLTLGLCIACVTLLFPVNETSGNAQTESPCCQFVQDALAAARQITPGLMRNEVEKQFEPDGGITSGDDSRYTYKKCLFIKIDVTFKRAVGTGPVGFNGSDVVVKTSKPYLEVPTTD
jgi:hypothetical protein